MQILDPIYSLTHKYVNYIFERIHLFSYIELSISKAVYAKHQAVHPNMYMKMDYNSVLVSLKGEI